MKTPIQMGRHQQASLTIVTTPILSNEGCFPIQVSDPFKEEVAFRNVLGILRRIKRYPHDRDTPSTAECPD